MKTILSLEEVSRLIEQYEYPSVSIYMPTNRIGNTSQDQIKLKNLLREADDQLVQYGIRSPIARQLLEPARKLLDDPSFWLHQEGGLAIFLSSVQAQYYCLPVSFEELLVVTNRFHVKPLIQLLTGDYMFYVLAISQNEVRLLRSTCYFTKEITPKTVPQSLAEVLKYDQLEKQYQLHTTEREYTAISHGQGTSKDYNKMNILRFFQQIDHGLHDLLREERSPLVVAAVDYLHPIYHQANTYSNLLDEGIKGNPEQLSDSELKERAWAIVQPYYDRDKKEAIASYYESAARGLTADDVRQVVLDAYDGRISTLFVAIGIQEWGEIYFEGRRVKIQKGKNTGSQDLLDFASVHTLLKGGVIYVMKPEEIPGGKLLAAILRY